MFLKICAAVLTLSVVIMSLLPGNAQVPTFDIWDKALHAFGYGVISFAAFIAFQGPKNTALKIAGFYCALGILLECAQYFIPGRYYEAADMLANLVGILIAWGLYSLFRRLLPLKQ